MDAVLKFSDFNSSESDDKERGESSKSNDENQDNVDALTRKDDFNSMFNNPETATGIREGDEIVEPSVKKVKLETDDLEIGSNEDGKDTDEQDDLRTEESEEDHFIRLFTLILNVIIDVKGLKDEEIVKSIYSLKDSRNFKIEPKPKPLEYDKFENIAAFLHYSSRLGAGLARLKILEAARNCKTLEKKLKKPNLNVICLGSGPGNDAIGFLSALSEIYYPENLRITVVDKFKEWFFCTKIADVFIKEDNFGKASEICKKTKVEFFYIDADIETSQTPKHEEYLQHLSEADVIIICRLITNLEKPKFQFTMVSVFQIYLAFIT